MSGTRHVRGITCGFSSVQVLQNDTSTAELLSWCWTRTWLTSARDADVGTAAVVVDGAPIADHVTLCKQKPVECGPLALRSIRALRSMRFSYASLEPRGAWALLQILLLMRTLIHCRGTPFQSRALRAMMAGCRMSTEPVAGCASKAELQAHRQRKCHPRRRCQTRSSRYQHCTHLRARRTLHTAHTRSSRARIQSEQYAADAQTKSAQATI